MDAADHVACELRRWLRDGASTPVTIMVSPAHPNKTLATDLRQVIVVAQIEPNGPADGR